MLFRSAGFVAVDGVDLQVREGSIHALIGPNGAGKTTTFNLLTRFLSPSAGSIVYRGRDITRVPAAQVADMGLVRSFQISAVFASLTLRENVLVALQRRDRSCRVFWRQGRINPETDQRIDALLAQVGLSADANQLASGVSYGKRRALEIATTLALEPDVLLLDEPTSGLGTEDVVRITGLIASLKGKKTVLMEVYQSSRGTWLIVIDSYFEVFFVVQSYGYLGAKKKRIRRSSFKYHSTVIF